MLLLLLLIFQGLPETRAVSLPWQPHYSHLLCHSGSPPAPPGLLVKVIGNCPTCLVSLTDDECVGTVESDSGVSERISQVLSVCAVRELGQDIRVITSHNC